MYSPPWMEKQTKYGSSQPSQVFPPPLHGVRLPHWSLLALGRVCHSRSHFPSTAFGYSHSKWECGESSDPVSNQVNIKNNDSNHKMTSWQVLQQKALHNWSSAKSRKSPIHSSFTTLRQGETWIWRYSTPPTVLLTSNGKKAGGGVFLTHSILAKRIKKHLQLEKEAWRFPSASRRTWREGQESTQLLQEWARTDKYGNSDIKKQQPTQGNISLRLVLTATKEGIRRAALH